LAAKDESFCTTSIRSKNLETNERILQKAEELFMRFGIRSVSMDDIAKELAVSKKTIYQFFKDKEALVMGVAHLHFNKDVCDMQGIKEQAGNALEEMILLSEHLKRNFMNINPVIFYDLQKYHIKAWGLFREHRERFIIETIKDNLRRGIADGLYRSDINVEILAILRVEEVQLGFNQDVFPSNRFNFLELQIQFVEHFMRGIITKKGFELLEAYQDSIKQNKI
jgi:AcrR family transcriptional regulator